MTRAKYISKVYKKAKKDKFGRLYFSHVRLKASLTQKKIKVRT